MDKKIIAFGHRKEVGKSTSAKFLDTFLRTSHPGVRVKSVGFADKLKDICFQLFKWSGLQRGIYYESHYEEKEIVLPALGMTPREVWIAVGNKMRDVWKNVWLDAVLKNISADIIIISDLRFINEATEIKAVGGSLVRIDRDVPRGTDPAEVNLADWTDWDGIIENNGTLRELNTKVIALAMDKLKI